MSKWLIGLARVLFEQTQGAGEESVDAVLDIIEQVRDFGQQCARYGGPNAGLVVVGIE
ncbi:hypothetical protein QMK17_24185 [Rhodococcus sp. G-MC3]|uniref:hypothetical protein n=1 Tax=Rhodococcus sp. G-MC3 TaxID=3046209 RepID=UPI0024B91B5B|nr:hypothetical protein [Rhodococcus sp. G-MC3]MDJ0396409.1 hypothetical protein [Rhodococcus sp. G-MC3]